MRCVNGYEIEALKSAAGYYIGTRTEEGMPQCRISSTYYPSKEEALIRIGKDYRICMENEFCSGGRNCYEGNE